MIQTIHQCSPETLETTTNPAHKGADSNQNRITISTDPAGTLSGQVCPDITTPFLASAGTTRVRPIISEAERLLSRRGYTTFPVRTSSREMIDLIAWNRTDFYAVAVRRVRRIAPVHDITERYALLIGHLQQINLPAGEVQLWISTSGVFHVYRVFAGGIMKRGLP